MEDKICTYTAHKFNFHKTSCGHMPTVRVIPAHSKEVCPYCERRIVWETEEKENGEVNIFNKNFNENQKNT